MKNINKIVIASLVLKPWQSIFFTGLILAIVFPSPVSAATKIATPSAISTTIETATSTAIPSENLEDKIKNLVKENLSATESNLKEAINLKSLVGHTGTIKSISSGSITIETDGNLFQVTVSEKTKITNLGIVSKLSSLAIANKVTLVGTLLKEDIIQAKIIKVIAEETDIVESDAIIASVTSVDLKKKLITLKAKNAQVSYTLSKKTTIKIADIKVGQTLFVITKKYQGIDSLSRAKIL